MKKLETRKLVASLEKASRKTKKKIWKSIAERLEKPSRQRPTINVDKLDLLAKKFKGKTLLIPGKVLSKGELKEKATIVAVEASEKAVEKISKTGQFILLKDFIEKGDPKKVVIVK